MAKKKVKEVTEEKIEENKSEVNAGGDFFTEEEVKAEEKVASDIMQLEDAALMLEGDSKPVMVKEKIIGGNAMLDQLANDIVNIIDENASVDELLNPKAFEIVKDLDALHQKCELVTGANIRDAYLCKKKIISYLRADYSALGVSAPQLGYNLRMFGFKDGEIITIFINPSVVSLIKPTKYTREYIEGCLSLPDRNFRVKRCWCIKVRYQDADLKWQERTFRDFRSVVFQHELDHLNGILISDKGKEVFDKANFTF